MKIVYYLNENREKNLYCRVSDGKERFTISLGQSIDSTQWDKNTGMPRSSSDFDLKFDIMGFKKYLERKYHELKLNGKQEKIMPLLKKEAINLFNMEQEPREKDWAVTRANLRNIRHKHRTENYLKAFLKFSGAKKKEIKYKPIGGHILILYKGTTYLVSHNDDFKEAYGNYFENERYDEIYTQTPAELWAYFLTDIVQPDADELMTAIYREWQVYWGNEKKQIKGGEQRYDRFRAKSFQDIQVFFQTLQVNPANAIKNASSINDLELIPLIAMAIYNYYDDDAKDDFYNECLSYIADYGEEFLTYGDTFESVCIDKDDEESDEWYYIYNPMFEFDD